MTRAPPAQSAAATERHGIRGRQHPQTLPNPSSPAKATKINPGLRPPNSSVPATTDKISRRAPGCPQVRGLRPPTSSLEPTTDKTGHRTGPLWTTHPPTTGTPVARRAISASISGGVTSCPIRITLFVPW
ncbi:hypothetical protein JCM33774_84680 [Actinophytocola sp. KF-1]